MILSELYQEEPHSTFTNDGKQYDLNKVLADVDDLPKVLFFVNDLKWVLQYDKPDPERMENADPKVPILVAYYGNQFVVVDGLHRLSKAVTEGKQFLRGKLVPQEILEKDQAMTERLNRIMRAKEIFTEQDLSELSGWKRNVAAGAMALGLGGGAAQAQTPQLRTPDPVIAATPSEVQPAQLNPETPPTLRTPTAVTAATPNSVEPTQIRTPTPVQRATPTPLVPAQIRTPTSVQRATPSDVEPAQIRTPGTGVQY